MTDFEATWQLSRGRFEEALAGLSHEQLNWRLHPGTITLGEAAVHVAGVEAWFVHQLTDMPLGSLDPRVLKCATDGVVNDKPFPFAASELTPELCRASLDRAKEMVGPVIAAPSPEVLGRKITSALGPIIDGHGAFARIAFHAGYHLGQAHLIKTASGFPA